MYYFILKSLSRCLKAIPEEGASNFLVGANTTNNSHIFYVSFNEESSPKLSYKEIVNFDKIQDDKTDKEIYNDIIDIYPKFDSNNKTMFYTQVFNLTQDKYQLKLFEQTQEGNANIESLQSHNLLFCDSPGVFE
jgi:hypothetical protein